MGYPRRFSIPVTTDASGDADEYSVGLPFGEIIEIRYVPDGTSPLATLADATITLENADGSYTRPIITITDIGTSAVSFAPRQPTHAVADGSALEYTAGEPVVDRISMVEADRIRVVIAQGGNTLSGTFYVTVL